MESLDNFFASVERVKSLGRARTQKNQVALRKALASVVKQCNQTKRDLLADSKAMKAERAGVRQKKIVETPEVDCCSDEDQE